MRNKLNHTANKKTKLKSMFSPEISPEKEEDD